MNKLRVVLIFLLVCGLVCVACIKPLWACFFSLLILGALGHIQRIFNLQWSRKVSLAFLIVFFLFSGVQFISEIRRDKKLQAAISGTEVLRDLDTTGLLPYQVVAITGGSKCTLAGANNDNPAIGIFMDVKGQIQTKGDIINPDWNNTTKPTWEVENKLFLSATPGEITNKPPEPVPGTILQSLGYIISIDENEARIYFEPKTPTRVI